MKDKGNLIVGAAFFVAYALAALQGLRVEHLREATGFYDWIIGASEEWAREGRFDPVSLDSDDDGKAAAEKVDQEFFDRLAKKVETTDLVPEVPETATDTSVTGEELPKMVRLVRRASEAQGEGEWDDVLWAVASSDEFAPERQDFLKYLREDKLSSPGSRPGVETIYRHNVSLLNMFLGFRKMAANLLWLQVDKYWHKGWLFRMIPLMKTTVTLDPHFIDAFLLGAWHLSYNATASLPDTPEPQKEYVARWQARVGPKERLYYQAIDFLKDGIRKNPRNYKLYFDLGYAIYELKLDDHANAVHYLSEAIRYKHDKWVPRQLYIALQKNGQFEEALAGWQSYMAKPENKDNVNGPRFIRINQAHIKERDAEAAQAKGDTATAERLRAEARAIWEDIAKKDQDPYALVRVRRMDALELASQGRYLEAVGILDQARYEAPDHFDAISDLIIRIKQEGGLPLYLSEKFQIARQAEADEYIANELKNLTGKNYELREGVWYEDGYSDQETILLRPGMKQLNALRAEDPDLGLVLAFRQPLVFQVDGTWYKFRPTIGL
jgi:tetratricopeptide (TPR) repeat protein